jgi:hypothetical protein
MGTISEPRPKINRPPAHDPLVCGLDADGMYPVRCPGCLAEQRNPRPLPTPQKVRHRKRGERPARLVRAHADAMCPVLLEILAADIGRLVAIVTGPNVEGDDA